MYKGKGFKGASEQFMNSTPQQREAILAFMKENFEDNKNLYETTLLEFLTELVFNFGQQAKNVIDSLRYLVPDWVYHRALGTEYA